MHVLGIDGGGSQTRALLCDASGRLLGQGLSGATNPRATPLADLRLHLHDAIRQATQGVNLRNIAAVHLGIAGAGDSEAQAKIEPIVRECLGSEIRITIGHDLEIAQVGGLGGEAGIVLVAGTGSACYGRNREGHHIETGGWGDLVDDAGSGSWIGLRALQACVRQADGRLIESPLKREVMEFLKIDHMDAFKARFHDLGLSRRERATLAPIIIDLAASGDAAAGQIVSEAVGELCELVANAERALQISNPHILLMGGLAESRYFSESLKVALCASIRTAEIVAPQLNAVAGAVLLALKSAQASISEDTIDNLKKSSYC